MDAATRQDISEATSRPKQFLDWFVGLRALAAMGALVGAVMPAVLATRGGDTLRGSISAYYSIDPRGLFVWPFTGAGLLLAADGVLSYSSPNRERLGRRWFNVVLGVALILLTWFDLDSHKVIHYGSAGVFFILFILVIAYTVRLGTSGRPVAPGIGVEPSDTDRTLAEVAFVFLGLLLLTGVAFLLGLVSFFFFEVFALVNFALYYVQGLASPFPYRAFEFRSAWWNRVWRALKIMPPAP